MADDKIVTKKTAAKPAAITKKAPAKAADSAGGATKKAAPKPAAAPTAGPAMTKAAAAAAAAAARPAAPPDVPAPTAAGEQAVAESVADREKPTARKAAPVRKAEPGEPPLADPDVHPVPLEEKPVSLQGLAEVGPERRLEMIREAAYYKAEKRGFAAGNDAQDWADAEREIDELLAKAREICGG